MCKIILYLLKAVFKSYRSHQCLFANVKVPEFHEISSKHRVGKKFVFLELLRPLIDCPQCPGFKSSSSLRSHNVNSLKIKDHSSLASCYSFDLVCTKVHSGSFCKNFKSHDKYIETQFLTYTIGYILMQINIRYDFGVHSKMFHPVSFFTFGTR